MPLTSPPASPFDEATESRSARIDLGAIRANVLAFAAVDSAPLLVGVEHDAYGHGLAPVAAAAIEAGATWLAVADLDEANLLRSAGVSAPLLVTGAAPVIGHAPDDVHVAVASAVTAAAAERAGAAGIHPMIDCGNAPRAMAAAEAALVAAERGIPVTGLVGVYGRGVSPAMASAALTDAKRFVEAPMGAVTHLCGDDDLHPAETGDLVSIRGSAYGLPASNGDPRGIPALSATGRVVTVKRIRAGEGVSYGYIYRAPVDGRIAMITGGYAQGVVRSLGNRASVSLHGRRCPIVGRVAMDVCVIDLKDTPAAPGDEAVFLGDPAEGEPSVSEWMSATGMSAIELVAPLARGFHRSHRS